MKCLTFSETKDFPHNQPPPSDTGGAPTNIREPVCVVFRGVQKGIHKLRVILEWAVYGQVWPRSGKHTFQTPFPKAVRSCETSVF